METLAQLMDKYDGNGFILIDDGNGSAGPQWVKWDEESEYSFGNLEMTETGNNAPAYEPESGLNDTIGGIAKMILGEPQETHFISDWQSDGEGDNPWRCRVIF